MTSNSSGATEHTRSSITEHIASSAGDTMSLDDAIAHLQNVEHTDEDGENILAAATTLRASLRRDRKEALRNMATKWGVMRSEKVDGK